MIITSSSVGDIIIDLAIIIGLPLAVILVTQAIQSLQDINNKTRKDGR